MLDSLPSQDSGSRVQPSACYDPAAMLPALLLLLGLAQPAEPRLFLWTIIGLGEPGSTILVTVTPTPFGLVSGVDIKAIALQSLPTRDDPKPRTICRLLYRTRDHDRTGGKADDGTTGNDEQGQVTDPIRTHGAKKD
jgi:hypothetical protein